MEKWTHFANIFKAFIGVNYLLAAFAISRAGIAFGTVGLVVVAIVTARCCILIVRCKHTATAMRRAMHVGDSDKLPEMQYGDVAAVSIRSMGFLTLLSLMLF